METNTNTNININAQFDEPDYTSGFFEFTSSSCEEMGDCIINIKRGYNDENPEQVRVYADLLPSGYLKTCLETNVGDGSLNVTVNDDAEVDIVKEAIGRTRGTFKDFASVEHLYKVFVLCDMWLCKHVIDESDIFTDKIEKTVNRDNLECYKEVVEGCGFGDCGQYKFKLFQMLEEIDNPKVMAFAANLGEIDVKRSEQGDRDEFYLIGEDHEILKTIKLDETRKFIRSQTWNVEKWRGFFVFEMDSELSCEYSFTSERNSVESKTIMRLWFYGYDGVTKHCLDSSKLYFDLSCYSDCKPLDDNELTDDSDHIKFSFLDGVIDFYYNRETISIEYNIINNFQLENYKYEPMSAPETEPKNYYLVEHKLVAFNKGNNLCVYRFKPVTRENDSASDSGSDSGSDSESHGNESHGNESDDGYNFIATILGSESIVPLLKISPNEIASVYIDFEHVCILVVDMKSAKITSINVKTGTSTVTHETEIDLTKYDNPNYENNAPADILKYTKIEFSYGRYVIRRMDGSKIVRDLTGDDNNDSFFNDEEDEYYYDNYDSDDDHDDYHAGDYAGNW